MPQPKAKALQGAPPGRPKALMPQPKALQGAPPRYPASTRAARQSPRRRGCAASCPATAPLRRPPPGRPARAQRLPVRAPIRTPNRSPAPARSTPARRARAAAAILASAETQVVLAVLGPCRDGSDAVAALGADRLLALDGFDASRYQPGACVQWLQALHAAWSPAHWLFADSGADGELGRRFALHTGLGLACGVVELGAESLRIRASASDDWLCPHAPVMLLAPGLASTRLPFV